MMVRRVAAPTGIAVFLSMACSDPPSPPAQAAVSTEVGTVGSMVSCGATHGEIVLPSGSASRVDDELNCNTQNHCKPDQFVLVDGDQGANVSCTVASAGTDQFNLALILQQQPTLHFEVYGTIGKTGGAGVTINESQGTNSISDNNCTLSIVKNANGTFGQVKPGAIWAHYTCSNLKAKGSAGGGVCSASGAFIFENCGGS